MLKNDAIQTEVKQEAKWNSPRERILNKIFGDKPCPITDISPTVRVIDKNWDKGIDFMTKPRMTMPMNMADR